MDITQIFGVAGAITYLASYFLLQLGFIRGNGFLYASMNMAAAALVLISLSTKFNVGSFIIQVSFITLSIVGILREWAANRPVKVTDEERELASSLLPGVPLRRAMSLIRKGEWVEKTRGELVKEGEQAEALIYLTEGKAKVSRGGHEICKLGSGNLIGDFSCLSGEAATADVALTGKGRFFKIKSNEIRELMKKDEFLKAAFESRLTMELRNKLALNSNAAVTV